MTWKEWTAVGAVIGVGIVLQIPGHDDVAMEHGALGNADLPAEMAAATGLYRTVALDVTGMT